MSVLSGRGGNLSMGGTVMSTIRNWRLAPSANNAKGTPSNTGNMELAVPGTTDWSGAWDFYGYDLPANPGQSYAAVFWNGAKQSSGQVLCTGVSFECNIEQGSLISGVATFGGQGALSHGSTTTPLTDSSAPKAYSARVGKATWRPIIAGTLGTVFDIPDVRTWGMSIVLKDHPYNSSNTAGVTSRTAAGLSASATASFYQSDTEAYAAAATRLTPGTPGILGLYVTGSLFYGLTYAVVSGSEINEDVEEGKNNAIDLTFDYSSFANISGTMTQGSIAMPTGGNFYP